MTKSRSKRQSKYPGITFQGHDKDGKEIWRVFSSGGYDSQGKRVRPSVRFHGSEKDAYHHKLRMDNDLKQHGPSSSMTFQAWSEEYIKHAEKTLSPTTVAAYRRMLHHRIVPILGKYRLDQLQSRHIAQLMKQLSTWNSMRTFHDDEGNIIPPEKISQHTQLKYYRLVSTILQEALHLGYIPMNPAKAVKSPRAEKYRARFYSQKDAQSLWEALQGEPLMWRAIISTALLLALRRGELVGLQWGDIDWQKKLVKIERAAYRVSGSAQEVKAPKTALSIRALPLFDQLVTILEEWKKAQGGSESDYICCIKHKNNMKWIHIDAPTKWFTRFIRLRDLPPLNLHGMRHTTATLMLAAGIPVHTVQEFLGHSLPSTTSNIYGHATDEGRERISGVLSEAFAPENAQPGANKQENESKVE